MAHRLITLGAKLLSILLGLGSAGAALTAASAFFTVGPESGGMGVIMVDGVFGAFILFIAARFLWIYAVRREQRAKLQQHSGQTGAG